MKYYLIALLFLLSLGQLQRIQLSTNLAFYLHDLLIIAFLGSEFVTGHWQIKKNWEKVKKIPKKEKIIFLAFLTSFFLGWLTALLEKRFDGRALLYLGRLFAYFLFILSLEKKIHYQSWFWRLVGINILFFGFIQYFFLPDLRFLTYAGYDDHYFRLTSTILDPAFTGLIFVFNLNYYLWQKRKNYFLIGLFMLALLLTYSRASYLAFLLSSSAILLLQQAKQKKVLILLMGLFCLALPLLPKQSGGDGVNLLRTVSIYKRISNDQEILNSMQPWHWAWGQGLFVPANNRLTEQHIPHHAHFADNFFVWSISNLGIVGSLCLAFWLIKLLIKKQKAWQKVLTLSLLSHALFNYSFTQSFVVLIFLGFYFSQEEFA